MTAPSRVVVGFDGSPPAQQALTWGAEAAERHHVPLLVLVAAGDPGYGGYSPLVVPGRAKAEEWAALAHDLLVASGHEGRTAVAVDQLPQRALVDASSPTSLVVVGARGHGRASGVVLGSVSQPVARHARGPVVVVRPPRDADARRIVVGLDGSPASERALDLALREAAADDRPLTAIHACTGGAHRAGDPPPWRGIDERRFPGVPVERVEVVAAPCEALVAASGSAHLVVVGAGHHRAVDALVGGSVSQDVLREARCSVAVVP
ncbi:MAG TPA: universal stress protein [Nocardioides sp.]|nr:universal stress protein [Nocardioides sp.]